MQLISLLMLIGSAPAPEPEPLDLSPREAEVLQAKPRIATGIPSDDPAWLFRGALRPATIGEPAFERNVQVNPRQIDLLRTLDKLRLFTPEDDLDYRGFEWRSIADKIGKPEVLTIPPRAVKK